MPFPPNIRVELTSHTIDVPRILRDVESNAAGAVVLFLGTTRHQTDGRATASLDYEAYDEMAVEILRDLAQHALTQWNLLGISIVHRTGHLVPPEASVAIAVSSAHRAEAFAAGQWLIDTLKEKVPIWKRENWRDGASDWVMPGLNRESVREESP